MLNIWNWIDLLRRYHENPFYDKEISEKKRILVVECHQYCINVWSDFHRADLGYCLKMTDYDKKIRDKKLKNQLVMSKLKRDDKHDLLVGLCDYDNFIKV